MSNRGAYNNLKPLLDRLATNPAHGTCMQCGAAFEDRSPGQGRRYCSDGCRRDRYDERVYVRTCLDCGKQLSIAGVKKGAVRCHACYVARRRAVVAERAERIVAWWREELTMREIAARLGWSTDHLGKEMNVLRKAGYNLPMRPPGGLKRSVSRN